MQDQSGLSGIELEDAEAKALRELVVDHFTVGPHTVNVFGTATASWSVTVPSTFTFPLKFSLNSTPVEKTGTKEFELRTATTFALTAASGQATRQLAFASVLVDASACQQQVIPAALIGPPLKQAIDPLFAGAGQVNLGAGGSTVTLAVGTITIVIPLTLSLSVFGASATVTIILDVGGDSSVVVSQQSVNVQVDTSTLSSVVTLGCIDDVGSAIEQTAQALLSHIVNAELVPQVSGPLNDQATRFVNGLGSPGHAFALNGASLSSAGLTLTACPESQPSGGGASPN